MVQEYKNENDNETLAAAILKSDKNKNKANWYVGRHSRVSLGEAKTVLRSLKKPWKDEHIQDLDEQSTLVLKNLAPPDGEVGI